VRLAARAVAKQPYRVPLMSEIVALPWNGRKVVSLFAGCGGSSTGYRMAGFKVLWANEFIPAARACYLANCSPSTILDARDVREVTADDILNSTSLKVGELDVLDGSPPCSAFSSLSKIREDGWGKVKAYSGTEQRVDDLFFEFTRILEGLQPRAFVAENVAGLIKGAAKGYFFEILKRLKGCGYRVTCKVLEAQWLGVPQTRKRTIFVGVRNDLNIEPVHPKPRPYQYTVGEALASLPPPEEPYKLIPGWRQRNLTGFHMCLINANAPSGTITTLAKDFGIRLEGSQLYRKPTIPEVKRICGFPDDFVLLGSYEKQFERLGRAVPPLMMRAVAETLRDEVLR